jgi:RNA polymerase sigma-70 factor (ECF subfamily)
MNKHNWHTRQSLIQRAKNQNDEKAWEDFVCYYSEFIRFSLYRMNIRIDDIDDLVQENLLSLWKGLQNYEKQNVKFRSWLSKVIRYTTIKYLKKKTRANKENVSFNECLNSIEAFSEPEMDAIVEEEWRSYLTSLVMKRMEKIFTTNALESFKSGFRGEPAEDVAQRLGISSDSVYTLRNRVKKSFVREARLLMNELEC